MKVASTPDALENSILTAQKGQISMLELLAELVATKLAVPSGGDIQADGSGFQPVLFDKDGISMVACFSSLEKAATVGDIAPFCLMIDGRAFLARVPDGHGVVVNPGQPSGFEIDPVGLRRIVAEFA